MQSVALVHLHFSLLHISIVISGCVWEFLLKCTKNGFVIVSADISYNLPITCVTKDNVKGQACFIKGTLALALAT